MLGAARLLIVTIGGNMILLWQWHQITAIGEAAIIRKANIIKLYRFAASLAEVACGYKPVKTLKEAKKYIEDTEQGVVREYNPIEEFIDPPKVTYCMDDLWRD